MAAGIIVELWTTSRYHVDNEMNKHEQTLETLNDIYEVMLLAEAPESGFEVKVHRSLLESSMEAIEQLLSIANDFAESFTITQGDNKPRVAIDVERFLAAKFNYDEMNKAIDAL